MRKPDLFIVGAPKCGTTALHRYLSQHPDIYMSEPKEPNYFGSLIASFAKSDEQYLQYAFSGWQDEKVAGEASPWYLACPSSAERIKAFNPRAKIVIMLRNPVEMMYSLHSELVFAGSEREADFARALDLEPARLRGELAMTDSSPPTKLAYRWISSFPDQVRRYLDCFGHEQVMVVLQEDMSADTEGTYRAILTFLGVDTGHVPDFPRVNANKETRSRILRKLLMHPPGWLRALARSIVRNDMLQHRIRHGMRMLNLRLNAKAVKRKVLQQELRAQLIEEKGQEVAALAAMLDRDLSHWLRSPTDC